MLWASGAAGCAAARAAPPATSSVAATSERTRVMTAPPRTALDDAVPVQRGDLVLAVAELSEDLVGVLAHVGRGRADGARCARERHRETLHRLLAEPRVLDGDPNPERRHVRTAKALLHVVHPAAR